MDEADQRRIADIVKRVWDEAEAGIIERARNAARYEVERQMISITVQELREKIQERLSQITVSIKVNWDAEGKV